MWALFSGPLWAAPNQSWRLFESQTPILVLWVSLVVLPLFPVQTIQFPSSLLHSKHQCFSRDKSYLVMCCPLLPLYLHKIDPFQQTGSLHLQPPNVFSQRSQAGSQVHRLLLAVSQSFLPSLPSPQQGYHAWLVPALQCRYAAAEPPLHPDGSLPTLTDITHGPWPARSRGLISEGGELVLVVILQLVQLMEQIMETGLQFLLSINRAWGAEIW